MLFRFIGVVRELGLHDDGASPIVFTRGGRRPLRVELRDERANQGVELRCDVTADFEPRPSIVQCFESLVAGRLPPGSLPPEQWPKPLAQLDASGEIRGPLGSVPMSYMPQSFRDFVAGFGATCRTRRTGLLDCCAGEAAN
jgi:hypothetical protein